uniref:Uncharacterized protein n=1 Tax=viral metagenome TaxID=1070528 RepID=A0A6M3LNM8_9ZZZZ
MAENIYPIWQTGTAKSTPIKPMAHLPKRDNINLHNLSFVIKLIRKPFWWKYRTNKIARFNSGIKPVDTGRYTYTQLKKTDYAIQFHKESIIVILRKQYHGTDAYDCFIKGMTDFLNIYDYITQMFQFEFFADGIPQAMVRSQHTVKLYDAIAKNSKRNGGVFEVWHDGKLRMLIDKSHPTGIEAIHREHTTQDIDRYVRVVEDVIVNNPPNLTELSGVVYGVAQNQQMYAENIINHIQAIKDLGAGVRELTKLIKELKGGN